MIKRKGTSFFITNDSHYDEPNKRFRQHSTVYDECDGPKKDNDLPEGWVDISCNHQSCLPNFL